MKRRFLLLFTALLAVGFCFALPQVRADEETGEEITIEPSPGDEGGVAEDGGIVPDDGTGEGGGTSDDGGVVGEEPPADETGEPPEVVVDETPVDNPDGTTGDGTTGDGTTGDGTEFDETLIYTTMENTAGGPRPNSEQASNSDVDIQTDNNWSAATVRADTDAEGELVAQASKQTELRAVRKDGRVFLKTQP